MQPKAIILLAFLAAPFFVQAQKLVDRRDQATGWYVPVKFRVTAQGANSKRVNVKIYRDNTLVHDIPGTKGKFTVNLDLENHYTVMLEKEGYRSKSISIDTHVPEQRVQYPMYDCTMDLEPEDRFTHADPFYMDFPSALVRWNDEAQEFAPQMEYVRHIQGKMAMLRAQMDPQ